MKRILPVATGLVTLTVLLGAETAAQAQSPSGSTMNRSLRTSGWTLQRSDSARTYLQDVEIISSDRAIAVGGRPCDDCFMEAVILRTEDGGDTWIEHDLGLDGWLQAVSFSDAETGTVVGPNDTILRTTDGGQTWTEQAAGIDDAHYSDVVFTDANTGIVLAGDGPILRTTDGGDSWSMQTLTTAPSLGSLSFFNMDIGAAVGGRSVDEGVVFWTTDGGVTWLEHESGLNELLTDVDLVTDSIAIAVSYWGTILRTTDGGTNWIPVNKTDLCFQGVRFIDPSHGWVVGGYECSYGNPDSGDVILYTADGGEAWMSQTLPDGANDLWDAGLVAVDFLDTGLAFAVGRNGQILRTTTGGVGTAVTEPGGVVGEIRRTPMLYQNYPNPFNTTTTISYSVPKPVEVTLTVSDIMGRAVRVLEASKQAPGRHEVTFVAGSLSSGVYLYRLQGSNFSETRTLILAR